MVDGSVSVRWAGGVMDRAVQRVQGSTAAFWRGPTSDLLVVSVVVGVMLSSLVGRASLVREDDDQEFRFTSPDAVGLALVLATAAPLLWRRRAPVAALGATCLAFVGYQRLGYAPPPLPLAALVALYTVSLELELAGSISAAVAMVGGILGLALTHHSPLTDDEFLAYVVSVLGAWMLGCTVQLNRTRLTLAVERAEQSAIERDLATEAALQRDRARIARELHDVVAHHVGLIVTRAGATLQGLRPVPGPDGRAGADVPVGAVRGETDVRKALACIESAGREAIVEMRRMLDVLGSGPGSDGVRPPRLDGLAALVGQTEQAGLPVRLRVHGGPGRLPAAVELTAYRIVQEALTNALKHAGPTSVEVDLEHGPQSLAVRVRDGGRGVSGPHADGRGILGMRQRVAALRGWISVGPRPEGGFEVTAVLPVEPPADGAAS
jgi:signal transduction histidine kinase